MAEASIPVDLLNPGQVFACLGFLEAADVLLGGAEGGFDWRNETEVRFLLRADGEQNPFAGVLKWLADVGLWRYAPTGYVDPSPKRKLSGDNEDEEVATSGDLRLSDTFPRHQAEAMALPVRLQGTDGIAVDLGHWTDGSSRNEFKLYAGNRSAYGVAHDMLRGKHGRSTNKDPGGAVETRGIEALWLEEPVELGARPFDVLTLMGGSFNFDARGTWTSIDAGFSIDRQKKAGNLAGVEASPVVQLLAAWGLEHARPHEYQTKRGDQAPEGRRWVRYGAWGSLIPPILARPALAGLNVGVPIRSFRFELRLSGKNKVVTFAQEEVQA